MRFNMIDEQPRHIEKSSIPADHKNHVQCFDIEYKHTAKLHRTEGRIFLSINYFLQASCCTFVKMESTRQLKFSRLIQKEMAEIFQQDARNLFGPVMVTVTHVRVSPDLGVAKIHVSLFPVQDKEGLLDRIRNHAHELRRYLGNRIRHQVRVIPELIFYIDDSLDRADRIDQLLKNG
jgi:ribosome-binding factor A